MKGNQKTGEVYIRTEYGLGEGILLTCQYDDPSKNSMTYGPFPLSFFMDKDYWFKIFLNCINIYLLSYLKQFGNLILVQMFTELS